MRIISQDGTIDVSYDLGNLSIAVGKVDNVEVGFIYFHSCCSKATKLAEYNSTEKAKKAMEMLHEEYKFERQFETVCSGMLDYPRKPLYYFRFPYDYEIEVEDED